MNLKYVLGLYLPLIIIGILVVLSTTEIGFNIDKQTKQSLPMTDVFLPQRYPYQQNTVIVQTVTITNDFFLPRRHELPPMVACTTGPSRLTFTLSYDYETRLDYDTVKNRQSIEVPMYSSKTVNLVLQPQYNYNNLTYDKLILVETPNMYSYNYCQKADLHGDEIQLT